MNEGGGTFKRAQSAWHSFCSSQAWRRSDETSTRAGYVKSVSENPPLQYNPELFWDAEESHANAKLPPGPNNPVGVVWIDLSKPHYGIHGTPEPSRIGKTQSHGCIRLTNSDAAELAKLVSPGTAAVLQE